MYFEKFFPNIFLIKSLKKKLAIIYNIKAPDEMDTTDIAVPTHLPNKIPEIIKSGDPNPRSAIHIIVNRKKIMKFM